MKENIRRVILFVVIVATGSVLILADIPVLFMVPLVIFVGFILLILLGAITRDEIRAGLVRLKPENIKKISIIQKLDSIKLFEKKSTTKNTPLPASAQETLKKPVKKPENIKKISIIQKLDSIKLFEKKSTTKNTPLPAPAQETLKKPVKKPEKTTGIQQHLQSLVSSLISLGAILKERGKSKRKVEDIDKMLDKTITEKVKSSALADAGAMAETSDMGRGGAGSTHPSEKEPDPFLSLSGDEFETGLLDSLDEFNPDTSAPAGVPSLPKTSGTPDGSDVSNIMLNDMDLPPLPDDLSSHAENILKSHAEDGEQDAFSMTEGFDSLDSDFGDLDHINFEDVDMGPEDLNAPAPDIPEPAAPAEPASLLVQNQGMNFSGSTGSQDSSADRAVDQEETASFASSAAADDDLLSSLASEIKTVKIDQNISLLRDLKEFRAPAADIENELQAMSDKLNGIKKKHTPGISEKTMK